MPSSRDERVELLDGRDVSEPDATSCAMSGLEPLTRRDEDGRTRGIEHAGKSLGVELGMDRHRDPAQEPGGEEDLERRRLVLF